MKPTLILFLVAAAVAAGAPPAAAQAPDTRDRVVVRQRERAAVERAQTRGQRALQLETFSRTLKIGSSGEIHIGNIAGSITVTRGGGSDATLEVVKTARARTEDEARAALKLVQVDISERGSRADIKTRYPHGDEFRRNWRDVHVSVAFTVTAPANTRLTVNSISGDISTRDIKGDLALESVSGAIRIANGGRGAAAKSISGSVEVLDTELEGHLNASSVSGTVLLRNLKARSLSAETISGSVKLEDVQSGRVEAQSMSGEVEFAGPLTRSGHYEMKSHSGSVRVAVPADSGFELEATSFSGAVRSDFAVKSDAADQGRRRPRALRGTHGDGSALLEVTTFSGSIVIARR